MPASLRKCRYCGGKGRVKPYIRRRRSREIHAVLRRVRGMRSAHGRGIERGNSFRGMEYRSSNDVRKEAES